MGYDLDKLYEGPRSERRAKKRKVNMILNVLIAIVILLIIFFGGKLFFGDKPSTDNASNGEQIKNEGQPTDNETEKPVENEDKDTVTEEENTDTEDENSETTEPDSDDTAVVTEGDPASNISQTIEDSNWAPIGTSQSEPHTTNINSGSADRTEIENAASYATGLDQSNMIVWWISKNKSVDNSVTVTVSSKDNVETYRVYLSWISNEGWKPDKVEKLIENDTKPYKEKQ